MQRGPFVIPSVPAASAVRLRIGRLLRELHVARRLLTVAELADRYRSVDSTASAGDAKLPVPPSARQGVTRA